MSKKKQSKNLLSLLKYWKSIEINYEGEVLICKDGIIFLNNSLNEAKILKTKHIISKFKTEMISEVLKPYLSSKKRKLLKDLTLVKRIVSSLENVIGLIDEDSHEKEIQLREEYQDLKSALLTLKEDVEKIEKEWNEA